MRPKLRRNLLVLGTALAESTRAELCFRNITCSGPSTPAFPGPWESYIYAPAARNVTPVYFVADDGASSTNFTGAVSLKNNGSQAVLDFGAEVGGFVSFTYCVGTGTGTAQLGLAFSESKNWIGTWSDDSNGGTGRDGALYVNVSAKGAVHYTVPDDKLRGGFRYLTLFLETNTSSTVNISDISLEIGFQPTWSNLRAYQGYFHSNDETLNRIWYSGAYTLQTNTVPPPYGRTVPFVASGWSNAGWLGPGDTIIVDGAKRDRAVWPGDMGIAVPSTLVSIGDLTPVMNALQAMYDNQNSDGSFPEAGPPLLQQGSDTYHMWTMIGTYNYVLYSDDTDFLLKNWNGYLAAMEYICAKVGDSGLLNVTGTRDWARWQQGFNNSEANMILYRTLKTGAELATWSGSNATLNATYLDRAADLKAAINVHCWDAAYGAFKDNATATTLHPQDANAMAILFNATDSSARAQNVSSRLLVNWTPIGAVAPELPDNISPFISSFEVQAHFAAGQPARALDLIRRSWGWYLENPNGTQSTVIEGYRADGSFAYRADRGYNNDPSYVSHSHGWSSGPTSALTEYVLGLQVTGRGGATWRLSPQFADLTRVEGGFTTGRGKFQALWALGEGGNYTVSVSTPHGTAGEVVLPALAGIKAGEAVVTVDGKEVEVGEVHMGGLANGSYILQLGDGNHTITVLAK